MVIVNSTYSIDYTTAFITFILHSLLYFDYKFEASSRLQTIAGKSWGYDFER